MPRLFLSHSSDNNAAAVALRDWLRAEGWDDVFLDFDATHGIAPGERWEQALREAIKRCEAVIFLLSRSWLASDYCREEFNLAHHLNKQLFGVLIDDLAIEDCPWAFVGTWQMARLISGGDQQSFCVSLPLPEKETLITFSRDGLVRLRRGLTKAGLNPRFFDWPPATEPDRPPYPGMRPLEAEDAGIFFGRDAPIIDALDHLRGLRRSAPPRFFVIIGASGAGKSSFLRAGLIPRLLRDDQHFLPLPAFRPERATTSRTAGFIAALEKALCKHGIERTREAIEEALEGSKQTLLPLLQQLVKAGQPPAIDGRPHEIPPTLVVSIDQGEELFPVDGAEENDKLLALCRDLLEAETPQIIILCTIRSDTYERLQKAKTFEGIGHTPMSLPSMPHGAYQLVIEGPVARLNATGRKLTIEPGLTQRLLEDIQKGGSDALPLLALTLEELYMGYGGSGTLKLSDYESEAFGGITGAIERVAERALKAIDADPKILGSRTQRLTLLRQGLIPWLVDVDPETHRPRRRSSRMSDIPSASGPLIQHLVDQRLLSTDHIKVQEADHERIEIRIEPSHEALLRQWKLLSAWLEEDSGALAVLDGVKQAAHEWVRQSRREDRLIHTRGRLEDAERAATRNDLAADLTPDARDYLRLCRTRENKVRTDLRAQFAGDCERILGHLRESQFDRAKDELDKVVNFLGQQTYEEFTSRRAEYEEQSREIHDLATFYNAATRVYSLAGEEDFPGSSATCEQALRALCILNNQGVFNDGEWWNQLPTKSLSNDQIRALHRETYRQLILYSLLCLVPGTTGLFPRAEIGPPRSRALFDPAKLLRFVPAFAISKAVRAGGFGPFQLPNRQDNSAALISFRKSVEALAQIRRVEELWASELAPSHFLPNRHGEPVQHSLTTQFVGRIAEILSEFAGGPKGDPIDHQRLLTAPAEAKSTIRPEPINAADYFFIGLLNYFVAKRRDESTFPQIMSLLGQLFPYIDGQAPYEMAERLLRVAIGLEPQSYWPHWLLGRVLLGRKHFSAAELAFNAAVAVQPGYARGYEQRALAIGEQWAATRDPALRQRSEDDSNEARRVAADDASIYWPRGELLKRFGENDAALDAFAHWLEYEEDLSTLIARVGSVTQLYTFTQALLRDKPAAGMAGRLLAANASAVLGWVYLTWKNDELALQAVEEALRIDSQHAHALVAKGVVLIARNKFDEAAGVLTRARTKDPSNCRSALELARLYERMGNSDAAITAWKQLSTMCGTDVAPTGPGWMAREAEARLGALTAAPAKHRTLGR